MGSTGPDRAARRLVEHLAELEDLQALLIGGMAVNFWVEPRFTKDVDFTIRADASLMERVTVRLLDAGFRISRIQGEDDPLGPDFVPSQGSATRLKSSSSRPPRPSTRT